MGMYNKLCCYQTLHSTFCSLLSCDAYVDAVCIKMSCPKLQIEEQPVDDLMDLVKQIVPFHVKVWRGLLNI
jgi:hypothetical protein